MAEEKTGEGKNTVLTFIISLIAGATSIYIGAILVFGTADFMTALSAALIGAIVWGLFNFFLGWFPVLGSIITLLAWLGAINWIYPGGWFVAAQIALLAWLASIVILYISTVLGLTDRAIGVPD